MAEEKSVVKELHRHVDNWNRRWRKGGSCHDPGYEYKKDGQYVDGLLGKVLGPFAEGLGRRLNNVEVLKAFYRIHMSAHADVLLYDDDSAWVWGVLMEAYRRLPVVDQVFLCQWILKTEEDWLAEKLFYHLKTHLDGAGRKLADLFWKALHEDWPLSECRDILSICGELVLEQALAKAG